LITLRERLTGTVNYEIFQNKTEEEWKRKLLEELESMMVVLPTTSTGTASELVREDRDSH